MKLIMVAAISKDGFLTKGDDPDPTKWTSDEDKAHFKKLREEHNLFVMGSKTYEANKKIRPAEGTLRVVLTRQPEKYTGLVVPGQLEFYNMTPQEFVKKYESSHDACLVLGGSYVFLEFLEAGLLTEIYLTIEPITNEKGVPLLANGRKLIDFDLPVPNITVLNDTGTELLHYIF